MLMVVVNIQDLVLVASNFGKMGQNAADVNNDGVVNIVDLTLVAGAIGGGAGAPVSMGSRSGIRAYTRPSRTVVASSTAGEPDGPNLSARASDVGAAPCIVNTQRDGTFAELPESVQPGDVDPVSVVRACRC